MSDPAHKETDRLLKEMEKKIAKEYRQAEQEISEKMADYLRRFEKKDKTWQKWVKTGYKTEKQYKEWKIGQMAMGKRWADLRDTLAQDLRNANKISRSIVKGYMPDVYAINHNYATYEIEHGLKIDTSYTLYDHQTVERLLRDDPDLLPTPGENVSKDIIEGKALRWNKKQIQSVMIQSILQGESIPDIATRLAETVGESERKAAVRNARTMTTGTENAGRVDGYKRAQKMGINVRQQWVATLDGRTRHEHRLLDGQVTEPGEPFNVEGELIRFPGDPWAAAHLIYNCRCTLIASLKGHEINLSDPNIRRRKDEDLGGMSYSEWKKSKATYSNPILLPEEKAAAIKESYIREYMGRKPEAEDKKNPNNQAKVSHSPEYDSIINSARNLSIQEVPVEYLKAPLNEEEIVAKVGGPDKTGGSCVSAAFAFIANKLGLDVLDFRGGESRSLFSYRSNSKIVKQLAGAQVKTIQLKKESLDGAKAIVSELQDGKKYMIGTGHHAAIVRRVGSEIEYLELQSSNNGWKHMGTIAAPGEKQDYSEIAGKLRSRFACRKTVSGTIDISDLDEFKDTPEFRSILTFINTGASKQKKGTGGYAK